MHLLESQHYWPWFEPGGQAPAPGSAGNESDAVGDDCRRSCGLKEASPEVPSKEQYYEPVEQFEKSLGSLASPTDLNGNGSSIVVRTALEPELMANVLRATVRSIDPQLPLSKFKAWSAQYLIAKLHADFHDLSPRDFHHHSPTPGFCF
jgi:hypothetical protein